ncbi:hypothetical protein HMF3257_10405 [Spirosoma telluris]|uniref:Uncharacterized protein n=1 Tax=Spirosoma telluris TaxID=2183553 RepID=A0A327NGS9_9BACT|nr:hypothetical protein HMF3257_10405 [Spirosoma telluris]
MASKIKIILTRIGYFPATFFLFSLIGLVYAFTWTNYEYTVYQMPNCSNTFFTKIEYTRVFYRGVAFTYGIRKQGGLPESECFVSGKMTGMDAILELWVRCESKKVVLYCNDLRSVGVKNSKIFVKETDAEQINTLSKSPQTLHLLIE